MKDDKKPKIIRRGSIKYKKITHAPTEGVDSMVHVSIDFMKEIFDLEQSDYFITDEARLLDFTEFGSEDIKPFINKIKKVYGVDVSDVPKGNLLEIFRMVEPHMPKGAGRERNASRHRTIKTYRRNHCCPVKN